MPVEARKRSWLRVLVATTLVLIAVVAVGLAVIQTPRGFKLVVLPLAERWSGGTLQAESGRFSLDGRLEVAGLTYESPDATSMLSADHLVVSLDPLSFVLGNDPLVHELELVGARLVSREAAHKPVPALALEPVSAPAQLIPLTVERARLRDVTAEVIRRDAVELRIEVVDGSLEGLAPGQTAHLEATTEIAVAPDDPARSEQIAAKGELGVRQDATRTSFEWSGNFDATVREGIQTAAVQGVEFSSAMRGSYKDAGDGQGQLRARAFIDARHKETAIGSVVAELEWTRSAEANRIDAALELSSITQDFLNPFLAPLGSARLASAHLDGNVEVRTEEGRTTFESQLRAKDWTLALGEQNGRTPPVDFRSEVSGLWRGGTRELVVSAANLEIDSADSGLSNQIVLEGSLSLQDRARADVRGEIAKLDMGIYLDALALTDEASPAKATAPQPPSSESLELPFDFTAELGIGEVRWREVELAQGRVAVSASGGKWSLNLFPTQVVDGSLRGKVELDVGEKPRLAWNVQGSGLDVARLARSLEPGAAPHIAGRLELSSKATGSAPSMKELRDALTGDLGFNVTDGQLRDLALLKFVTDKTGIGGFNDMTFHNFIGRLELADGQARIQQMEVTGLVRSLVFEGQVGLGGELDLRVNPRISPELTGALRKTQATEALFATTDNWLALPMDITVKGQLGNTSFGVRTWGSDMLGGALKQGRKLTGEVFRLGKKSYGKVRGRGTEETAP